MLHGTPIDERDEDGDYPLPGIGSPHGTVSGDGILVVTTLFGDTGVPGYFDLTRPRADLERVALRGVAHEGAGELERLQHLEGDRYAVGFNIDGCSWAYEARLHETERELTVERLLVGAGELAGGVLHGLDFDEESGRFALAFCTATMPTQLYVLEPEADAPPRRKTRERALGLPVEFRRWPAITSTRCPRCTGSGAVASSNTPRVPTRHSGP